MDAQNIILKIFQNNKLQKPIKIKAFGSGQINRVYNIDNQYVVKLEGNVKHIRGMYAHQAKIIPKLIRKGICTPEIISYGEIGDCDYLLMRKVEGRNLIFDWLKFSRAEKENFIAQIVEQLCIFHSINFSHYAIPVLFNQKFKILDQAILYTARFDKINRENFSQKILEKIDFLKKYLKDNQKVLAEEDTAVFVHNDIHFENIFYHQNKISGIIDFDIHCYAPRDYELRKIVRFFREPVFHHSIINSELKKKYSHYRMRWEMSSFRKYYPDLFAHKDLIARIRLYYLDRILNILDCYAKSEDKNFLIKFNQEFRDIYMGDWLERFLG